MPVTINDGSTDWIATGACFVFAALGPFLFGYDIGVSPGEHAPAAESDIRYGTQNSK